MLKAFIPLAILLFIGCADTKDNTLCAKDPSLYACNGQCVDLVNDDNYCGGCSGKGCEAGESCADSTCSLPCDRSLCNGQCLNFEEAEACCGGSGKVCKEGEVCLNTQCIRKQDFQRDDRNCGTQGNACPKNASCIKGSCQCTNASASICNGTCVDLNQSDNHCGACGKKCTPPLICDNGTCTCPPDRDGNPRINCGTNSSPVCVNPKISPSHCGACKSKCTSKAPLCSDGVCQSSCGVGFSRCDNQCVALGTNEHCSKCKDTCSTADHKTCNINTNQCECTIGYQLAADGTCKRTINAQFKVFGYQIKESRTKLTEKDGCGKACAEVVQFEVKNGPGVQENNLRIAAYQDADIVIFNDGKSILWDTCDALPTDVIQCYNGKCPTCYGNDRFLFKKSGFIGPDTFLWNNPNNVITLRLVAGLPGRLVFDKRPQFQQYKLEDVKGYKLSYIIEQR